MIPLGHDPDYSFLACIRKSIALKVFIIAFSLFLAIISLESTYYLRIQVGCRTKWDIWSDQGLPLYSSGDQFRQLTKTFSFSYFLTLVSREYDSIFKQLAVLESEEISSVTGCLKPCHYKKYILLRERSSASLKSDHYIFSLWAVSSKTKVETEELIYPMSTLVAEFGGILGLFLGFSFISLWDNFGTLKKGMAFFKSIDV